METHTRTLYANYINDHTNIQTHLVLSCSELAQQDNLNELLRVVIIKNSSNNSNNNNDNNGSNNYRLTTTNC